MAEALNRIAVSLEKMQADADYATQRMKAAEAHASALEAERNALRQSASWRITAPLRLAGSLVAHPQHIIDHTLDVAQRI